MKLIYTNLILALTIMCHSAYAQVPKDKQIDLADGGKITMFTTYPVDDNTDIILSRTNELGNEVWVGRYGGKSWDKSADFAKTKDGGYIIVGSTSSYGKGNYDIYLIKVDGKGKKEWQKTFGGFYNEYGKTVNATEYGYTITGTRQDCSGDEDDPTPDCGTFNWIIKTDLEGNRVRSGQVAK